MMLWEFVYYKFSSYVFSSLESQAFIDDFEKDFCGFSLECFEKLLKEHQKGLRHSHIDRGIFAKSESGYKVAQTLVDILDTDQP